MKNRYINQKPYPQFILKLNDIHHFAQVVKDHAIENKLKMPVAYAEINAEYLRLFGRSRFINYKSFKNSCEESHGIMITRKRAINHFKR
jgi:hypothetical protein